jgi:hypothetical protein
VFQLLGWLAEKLPSCKKLPPEFGGCVPYLFTCLEDRNADVRKKANEAVLPFMIQLGYEGMVRHASKVKVWWYSLLFHVQFHVKYSTSLMKISDAKLSASFVLQCAVWHATHLLLFDYCFIMC